MNYFFSTQHTAPRAVRNLHTHTHLYITHHTCNSYLRHTHTRTHTSTHTHTHTHTYAQQLHCGGICCVCVVGVIVRIIRHCEGSFFTPTMQKDTHKVKSYKFVCKVPPQCSPVGTKTHKKNTTHKMNVKSFWGYFSMFILIHPETYFIRIAPPLQCGGTPTMSNCTCIYSHNVAILRSHTHTCIHKSILTPKHPKMQP